MKMYKVTLQLIMIEAKDEEEAKEKFWEIAIEDKANIMLDVEEMEKL